MAWDSKSASHLRPNPPPPPSRSNWDIKLNFLYLQNHFLKSCQTSLNYFSGLFRARDVALCPLLLLALCHFINMKKNVSTFLYVKTFIMLYIYVMDKLLFIEKTSHFIESAFLI